MKKCSVCKQTKPYSEFAWYGKQMTRNACKICYAGLQKIKMRHRKIRNENENNKNGS